MKILSPLRDRDFSLLWAGLAVSMIGDGIYLVAIAWQAYDISNTPSALAIVGLAWSLGLALFLLLGGVIADRVDRRLAMITADVVRAAVLVTMGLMSLAGTLEIWHMVILVLIYAAGEAFFTPAMGALVPDILEADQLPQASALEQFVRQASRRLIGPVIGGALVATLGPGGAFLVDAATFLVSATAVSMIRTRPSRRDGDRTSMTTDLVEGFRYVRERRWLWVTFLASTLATLAFFGPLEVLLPYLIRNELGGGAHDFGIVLAADGAGAILASILIAQRGLPRRHLTVLYFCWAAATLPLVGFALASSVFQLMLLSATYGALITVGLVIWVTLQQTRVPAHMRGRVRSVDWLTSIGLAPLSFALVGPASAALGVKATMILAGIVPAVSTLLLYFAFRLKREEIPLNALAAPPIDTRSGGAALTMSGSQADYVASGAASSAESPPPSWPDESPEAPARTVER